MHKQIISVVDYYACGAFISSPEPKAEGELLWSLTVSRRRRRPSVRPSIHNI